MTTRFEFKRLVYLVGRSENDPEVRNFFGHDMFRIVRDEYYGSLEFVSEGVDAVFQEAPWVIPEDKVTDPSQLYLAAFHFHREAHEGYTGYSGRLPNDVSLGDTEEELLRKMGEPLERGGGDLSPALKRPIPFWFWFAFGDLILHFQLDPQGRVDMATLQTPEVPDVIS
jgi:hypothetical protein